MECVARRRLPGVCEELLKIRMARVLRLHTDGVKAPVDARKRVAATVARDALSILLTCIEEGAVPDVCVEMIDQLTMLMSGEHRQMVMLIVEKLLRQESAQMLIIKSGMVVEMCEKAFPTRVTTAPEARLVEAAMFVLSRVLLLPLDCQWLHHTVQMMIKSGVLETLKYLHEPNFKIRHWTFSLVVAMVTTLKGRAQNKDAGESLRRISDALLSRIDKFMEMIDTVPEESRGPYKVASYPSYVRLVLGQIVTDETVQRLFDRLYDSNTEEALRAHSMLFDLFLYSDRHGQIAKIYLEKHANAFLEKQTGGIKRLEARLETNLRELDEQKDTRVHEDRYHQQHLRALLDLARSEGRMREERLSIICENEEELVLSRNIAKETIAAARERTRLRMRLDTQEE